jgi:hypothetical protein
MSIPCKIDEVIKEDVPKEKAVAVREVAQICSNGAGLTEFGRSGHTAAKKKA